MPSRFLLTLILTVSSFTGYCSDFIVTSNADAGIGTLREAITLANGNGIAVNDRILFNLPDQSIAGRTIVLLSTLPALLSHLEIDGSSQPGAPFGVTDAKVWLQYAFETNTTPSLFDIIKCTDIGIYGLKMDNQIIWTAMYEETIGLNIQESSNIRIGDIGKGNLIINWIHAIKVNSYFADESYYSNDIFIKSNVFSMEADGETPAYNFHLMEINHITNLQIGGYDPREGNTMAASARRIHISAPDGGTILIANNKIGTNFSGTKMMSLPYGEANLYRDNIFVGASEGWSSEINTNTEVRIINNLLTGYCGSGIKLYSLGKKFYIQGNRIGTDITGTKQLSPGMDQGILIENCRKGIIGVENNEAREKNIIAFGKRISSGSLWFSGSGVALANTSGIIISRNSIFCDELRGIAIDTQSVYKSTPITVNGITNESVSGTAPPNSKIEVFLDDNCPNCEGKTYLESFNADASGKWSINHDSPQKLVFTATDATTHSTSEFSAPYMQRIEWNTLAASCGLSNGAIKGWIIQSGTSWHWEDETGTIVGRDTNLINVPAGRYRLVVGIGNGCERSTDYIDVPGEIMPDQVDVQTYAASCGLNNGSAQLNNAPNGFSIQWLDATGNIVSDQANCPTLLPGSYKLRLTNQSHAECNKVFGPFTITNSSGPSLDISGVVIAPATCNNVKGSISGLQLIHANSTGYIAWKNESGIVVGNGLDLIAQPQGNYQLIYKEDTGCDTIRSSILKIPFAGEIKLDEKDIQLAPAACDGSGGDITGLIVTGADQFTWKHTVTGTAVGNSIDLLHQVPGRYQLSLSNSFGCSALSSEYIIDAAAFISPSPITIDKKNPYCGQDNGSITVTLPGNEEENYSFRWAINGNNQPMATGLTLENLAAANYELYGLDSNQCEGKITGQQLTNIPPPQWNGTAELQPETCSKQDGSIKPPALSSLQGPTTYTWTDAQNNIIANQLNIAGLSAGSYQLTVTDGGYCTITSPVYQVSNLSSALEIPYYKDQTIPAHTAALLSPLNFSAATYELYADPGGNQLLQSNASGIFTTAELDATANFYIRKRINECISPLATIKIQVVDQSFIRVPNAFSPNSDGKNDVLRLKVIGIVYLDYFSVYDRLGNRIFHSTDPAKGWDGFYNGKAAPSGNYVWIAGGKDFFGTPFKEKGSVLLLH